MGRRTGQGLVEYVLVVGLVGLALIGAVKAFRGAVDRSYGKVTAALERVATEVAATPGQGGAPAPTRGAMRVRDACLHPRVDDDGVCTRCGEAL